MTIGKSTSERRLLERRCQSRREGGVGPASLGVTPLLTLRSSSWPHLRRRRNSSAHFRRQAMHSSYSSWLPHSALWLISPPRLRSVAQLTAVLFPLSDCGSRY